jgi:hypothetical protein
MAGFLKEHPWITEWEYNWTLSIEKRTIYLVDAPSIDYKTKEDEDKEDEVVDDGAVVGSLSDALGATRRK